MARRRFDYNTPDISNEVEEKKEITMVVSNCEKVNFRKYPEAMAEVLDILDKGTEVIVDGEPVNDFTPVIVSSGIKGYIMTDFLAMR